MSEGLLLIGEFSARSRLSAKALRLYDEAGLLVPVCVDASTGYRWYAPDQLRRARLIECMRFLQMPLARIREVLDAPADDAAWLIRVHGQQRREQLLREQAVMNHVCSLLDGSTVLIDPNEKETITAVDYDVVLRKFPDRTLISTSRYVRTDVTAKALGTLLAQMDLPGEMDVPGQRLPGLSGCPFISIHCDVSQDDGTRVELVRPMTDLDRAQDAAAQGTDLRTVVEPEHDAVTVTVTMAEMDWASHIPAVDALVRHARAVGRVPSGPPRKIMIMDWRSAGPRERACVLALPLRAEPELGRGSPLRPR